MPSPLTAQQQRFVDRYWVDGDVVTAAKYAGYSGDVAVLGQRGVRLLRKPQVQRYLALLRRKYQVAQRGEMPEQTEGVRQESTERGLGASRRGAEKKDESRYSLDSKTIVGHSRGLSVDCGSGLGLAVAVGLALGFAPGVWLGSLAGLADQRSQMYRRPTDDARVSLPGRYGFLFANAESDKLNGHSFMAQDETLASRVDTLAEPPRPAEPIGDAESGGSGDKTLKPLGIPIIEETAVLALQPDDRDEVLADAAASRAGLGPIATPREIRVELTKVMRGHYPDMREGKYRLRAMELLMRNMGMLVDQSPKVVAATGEFARLSAAERTEEIQALEHFLQQATAETV